MPETPEAPPVAAATRVAGPVVTVATGKESSVQGVRRHAPARLTPPSGAGAVAADVLLPGPAPVAKEPEATAGRLEGVLLAVRQVHKLVVAVAATEATDASVLRRQAGTGVPRDRIDRVAARQGAHETVPGLVLAPSADCKWSFVVLFIVVVSLGVSLEVVGVTTGLAGRRAANGAGVGEAMGRPGRSTVPRALAPPQ